MSAATRNATVVSSAALIVARECASKARATPLRPSTSCSRREAYSVAEVGRVLRPGGAFITQQVDGRTLSDLTSLFGIGPAYPHVVLAAHRAELEVAGFIVTVAQEWSGSIAFTDVDTLLSYLRKMPWHLPADFTVDAYADALLGLRARSDLSFTEGRFVLAAHRGSLTSDDG